VGDIVNEDFDNADFDDVDLDSDENLDSDEDLAAAQATLDKTRKATEEAQMVVVQAKARRRIKRANAQKDLRAEQEAAKDREEKKRAERDERERAERDERKRAELEERKRAQREAKEKARGEERRVERDEKQMEQDLEEMHQGVKRPRSNEGENNMVVDETLPNATNPNKRRNNVYVDLVTASHRSSSSRSTRQSSGSAISLVSTASHRSVPRSATEVTYGEEEDEEEDLDLPPPPPKRTKGKSRAVEPVDSEGDSDGDNTRRGRKSIKVESEDIFGDKVDATPTQKRLVTRGASKNSDSES